MDATAHSKIPVTQSLKLDSAALQRLVQEVRNDAISAPTAYNRVHNRHNR